MKYLTIGKDLFKIKESDWIEFEKRKKELFTKEDEGELDLWDELLDSIKNKYKPIAKIEGAFNY